MEEKDIVTVIVAIIGSGAVFGFLQFIIQFLVTRADMKQNFGTKLEALNEKIDENQAINARVHILRFADELRSDTPHSLDYYKQTLIDSTYYERYVLTHPNFSNGITELSVEYIKDKYREELERSKSNEQSHI